MLRSHACLPRFDRLPPPPGRGGVDGMALFSVGVAGGRGRWVWRAQRELGVVIAKVYTSGFKRAPAAGFYGGCP